MSETEEYKVVDELRPGLRGINVKVRCASKNEEREVVSRRTGETLRVTEALVGDETGSILCTLWNDDIDKIQVDQNFTLTNAYTTVFKGSLRLNIGKYGSMESLDEESPAEVNEENNLSDKVYEQEFRGRPRFGGSGGGGGGGGRRPYGRDSRGGGGGRPYGRDNRGGGQRRRY